MGAGDSCAGGKASAEMTNEAISFLACLAFALLCWYAAVGRDER